MISYRPSNLTLVLRLSKSLFPKQQKAAVANDAAIAPDAVANGEKSRDWLHVSRVLPDIAIDDVLAKVFHGGKRLKATDSSETRNKSHD